MNQTMLILFLFFTTVLSDCIIQTDIQFVISVSNSDINHCPENRICSTNQLIANLSTLVNKLGIIQFDKTASVVLSLNSQTDQLNQYINNPVPISSSILTDKQGNGLLSNGLVQAMQQYSLYGQINSQKLLVVILDNFDYLDQDSANFVINVLKSQFVVFYGILIGNNYTKLPFLKQHMLTGLIDNWSNIISINKDLEQLICNQFDYCNSNSCFGHGVCINHVGSYTCQCDFGYIDSTFCQILTGNYLLRSFRTEWD